MCGVLAVCLRIGVRGDAGTEVCTAILSVEEPFTLILRFLSDLSSGEANVSSREANQIRKHEATRGRLRTSVASPVVGAQVSVELHCNL